MSEYYVYDKSYTINSMSSTSNQDSSLPQDPFANQLNSVPQDPFAEDGNVNVPEEAPMLEPETVDEEPAVEEPAAEEPAADKPAAEVTAEEESNEEPSNEEESNEEESNEEPSNEEPSNEEESNEEPSNEEESNEEESNEEPSNSEESNEEEPAEEVASNEEIPEVEEIPAVEDVPAVENKSNNSIPHDFGSLTNEEILDKWDTTIDFKERDSILAELQRRDLFPSSALSQWEYETGAYPDVRDPEFLQKLLSKREFAESLQTTWKPRINPCDDNSTFEVTPVQRFVSNFMSPKTPYMSALLFHGVGVGKTCAATQIAEAWLEYFPHQEVLLVAPPTIQQGFFRTFFDISKVVLGEGDEPNTASQCTGTTYMKLTNTLYERDLAKIEKAVNKLIKRRYKVFGYISFANYISNIIDDIPKGISDELRDELMKKYIRNKFSGKLLIVDEAHNLRDLTEEGDTEGDYTGGKAEKGDAAGGKQLTPYLRNVLKYAEGMKFCALTATPMYNSYNEIIFMLNLLLLNDKKATIIEEDIFDRVGNITENGSNMLSYISQRYVSFMRGENPLSFPIRLFADHVPTISTYPTMTPRGVPIDAADSTYYTHLPIVPIVLKGETLKATISFMNKLPPGGKGISAMELASLVHAGNFIVPAASDANDDSYDSYKKRTDINALTTAFIRESSGGETRYRAKPLLNTDGEEGREAEWLAVGPLATYSQKFEFFIERVRTAEGCIFAYTRFVGGGAVPLALALEANGYLPYGRKSGLLANGIQAPGGRQCALCPKKEKDHGNTNHAFSPAYYGILTGDASISPHNEQTIKAQRAIENTTGIKMKVIIGSQIASEGVDLRFVRETHIIDSWFHLNKTEQILGRAIRFLSHCALPVEKRNNTVYLYTAILPPSESPRETADLYSYRIGFKKAVLIGNVTRIMKQSAIDCNLHRDAIIIKGQDTVVQMDAQRQVREEVSINDMPFTAVCDWIETCEYKCKPTIQLKDIDDSTYDEFSSRWRIQQMKERIRTLFSQQTFYQSEDLWNMFADIPRLAAVDLLSDIVNNKTFQVKHGDRSGYIRYCNGYYIFQPNVYTDLTIPLAIRVAKFPVKRDTYTPMEYEEEDVIEEKTEMKTMTYSIEQIWTAIASWVQQLSTSDTYIQPPGEIEQHIIDISHDDKEQYSVYSQILSMIEWLHTSFQKSTNKNPEALRRALLFYFWDEWLSVDEQKNLIYSTGANVLECIKENQYTFGKQLINRFIDPKTGDLHYLCEQGNQCATSVIDAVRRDKAEPIRSFVLNRKTTGQLYGFNVPKNGGVVFKSEAPPEEGGKLGRGLECGNVSTMTGHIINLIKIGDILQRANKSNFDLHREAITDTRHIRNSTRACVLLNLLLRFLNEEQVEQKQWFFRIVNAYYRGHKGIFRLKH